MYFSKRLGAACFAWSLLVVGLPRIYCGYHYASDILGGALIGFLSGGIVMAHKDTAAKLLAAIERVGSRYSGAFYAASFIISYQMVTLFADIRKSWNDAFNW